MKRLALALAVVLSGLVLTAQPAAADGECDDPADIPILVEYGSLSDTVETICAPDGAGGTALDVLTDAGLDLEGTADYGDSVVCRVDGQPDADEESCQSMPSGAYWGFFVSVDGAWEYAQKGVDQQELSEGDFVALAYQQSDDPQPPEQAPDDELRAKAQPADDDADQASESSDDDGSRTGLLIGGIVIVVVVAALVVTLLRRRRR